MIAYIHIQKAWNIHFAVPRIKAFASPLQIKQQPKSTPYV